MEFRVEQAVLDIGVKIVFAAVEGMDRVGQDAAWQAERTARLSALVEKYRGADLKQDAILEGFHILHDHSGVKRRKNIPAGENLIRLLLKNGTMPYINQIVDIYNVISMESKLALGAHDMDHVDGNVTLRFTDGTERFVPLGQTEPIPVHPQEYCYCDDANEVLCRLEVRQVGKTMVTEGAKNVFYIIQGNEKTPTGLLVATARTLLNTTTRHCGGKARIILPEVI